MFATVISNKEQAEDEKRICRKSLITIPHLRNSDNFKLLCSMCLTQDHARTDFETSAFQRSQMKGCQGC